MKGIKITRFSTADLIRRMLVLFLLANLCHISQQIALTEKDHENPFGIKQGKFLYKDGTESRTDEGYLSAMDIIMSANSKSGATKFLHEGDVIPKRKRNAVSISLWKWTDHKVPYVIKESDFSAAALKKIKDAIVTFNREVACISWLPRNNELDYVRIRSGAGCVSSIGKDGGVQDLFLGSDCYYTGVILHEMTHATGFYHEQSRYDRDKYVQVNWENILPDKRQDFNKETQYLDTLEAPYDYGSIMHYGRMTFSANGKPTLTPLFDPRGTMGQRDEFSELDVWKINKLYQCTGIDPPRPAWMDGQFSSSTSYMYGSVTTVTPSTKLSTAVTTAPPTTSQDICPEEHTLPTGIPGKPQNFQVFAFASALRVTWDPPCTTVNITGFNLIYWNSAGSRLSMRLPANKFTHYIGTLLHNGQRYQITIAAISNSGIGPKTDVLSTYSACGNDVFIRGNETYDRIYSPHYSEGYYEPDVACQWTVSAPEGQRLKLEFDRIDLSGSNQCIGDFLKIDDAYICSVPMTQNYILTKKNTVKIIFYSTPGSNQKPGGFHLVASVEDNTPRNVSIQQNIPGLFMVTWQPPEGKDSSTFQYKVKYRVYPEIDQQVVTLDSRRWFWPIRTQPHYGRQYEVELLTVTDGADDNSKVILIRTVCGGNRTVNESGIIFNPPSYGSYERDVVCEWNIKAIDGKHLVLTFNKLDLEVTENCTSDFVEIVNAGRFCKPYQTGSTMNTGQQVTVRFVTDMVNEKSGFELKFDVL